MNPLNSVTGLLRAAERSLRGFESARLDGELLLLELLDTGREWLYAHGEHEVAEATARDFFALVSRRLDGIPVAYLTGRREFWSLELLVSRHTLIPRPETEAVVEAALERLRDRRSARVLDLGTGSGAIALALARERPDWRIVASDISAEALGIAQRNVDHIGVRNVELAQSDWFAALANRRFDLIVCNPPYVDTRDRALTEGEIRFEPRLALDGGHGGLQAINAVAGAAPRHLVSSGILVLEHGADQGDAVRRLFGHCGFTAVETLRDSAGLDRVSCGRWE
ncbi:MAG: peptide chain release factor N(5)-glutamine methyltransferase [Gammaproteobacteria bacterium]|nr:peptide chain release factor N(5)-glutamine methyltransferase [Gammaproteobacteria bacterium]